MKAAHVGFDGLSIAHGESVRIATGEFRPYESPVSWPEIATRYRAFRESFDIHAALGRD